MRDGGQQVAEFLLRLLQDLDLLLGAREANRGMGGRRLVTVEGNELGLRVAELAGEPLRTDLRLAAPAGQESDNTRGAEKDGEVDEILLVVDGEGPHRRDEKVIDQQEADGRRQQGGPETANNGNHGDDRHIDEDVLSLW